MYLRGMTRVIPYTSSAVFNGMKLLVPGMSDAVNPLMNPGIPYRTSIISIYRAECLRYVLFYLCLREVHTSYFAISLVKLIRIIIQLE